MWFEEVAADLGIDFVHVSGHQSRHWFPEIMVGGICLFDYDNDGYLDIYLVQGGDLNLPPESQSAGNQLYSNRGDGTFENATANSGAADFGYGMGCATGDYDRDGDVDLYVTNVGRNTLYRNNGPTAETTFTDVTEDAGVGDASWSSSAAFFDYDGDGLLDLFVVNYVVWSKDIDMLCQGRSGQPDYCSPQSYKRPAQDRMFRNLGNGRFDDVTARTAMDVAYGNGLGVSCADYNNDGRLDAYVANDGTDNQLWLNSSAVVFSNQALTTGCAFNQHGEAEAGMGVAAVDVNQDGNIDLFMTHLSGETNTCYLNRGAFFEDDTANRRLATPSKMWTGFGVGFADFDHDGFLDLYVANGGVVREQLPRNPDDSYAEPNQLFRGGPDGRFTELTPAGGTAAEIIRTSRAAAFGDLDDDGDIDVVVANKDARATVLRNIVARRGNAVMFRVLTEANVDAIGAKVSALAGGRQQWRQVQTAYSYCASNDSRVHFGLGDASRVDRVTVDWPYGGREVFGPFDAAAVHELRQGRGRPWKPEDRDP